MEATKKNVAICGKKTSQDEQQWEDKIHAITQQSNSRNGQRWCGAVKSNQRFLQWTRNWFWYSKTRSWKRRECSEFSSKTRRAELQDMQSQARPNLSASPSQLSGLQNRKSNQIVDDDAEYPAENDVEDSYEMVLDGSIVRIPRTNTSSATEKKRIDEVKSPHITLWPGRIKDGRPANSGRTLRGGELHAKDDLRKN
jgi:hypothetical protein